MADSNGGISCYVTGGLIMLTTSGTAALRHLHLRASTPREAVYLTIFNQRIYNTK